MPRKDAPPVPDPPASGSLDVTELLARARDVAVVGGIVLFAIGYVYRYAYMRDLGIPVHATESSVNEILVYAGTVIERQVGWFALLAATVAVAFAAIERARASGRLNGSSRDRFVAGTTIAAAVTLVWAGQLLAERTADAAALEVRSGQIIKPVLFTFAPCEGARRCLPDDVRNTLNASSNVAVIAEENADTYFVVRSYLNSATHRADPEFLTLRIPKESVAVARSYNYHT
jgi:hypothetical protein